MLHKKQITGVLLGAFLGLGVITGGGATAEASALNTVVQPTSAGIVIVVDPFRDHYRHPAPPPHHYRHHAPPPHHRKHHPRPHHPRPHHR